MKKAHICLIALCLSGCNAVDPSVDGGYGDYHYRDILKLHGHTRSLRVLQSNARTCERRTGHGDTLEDLPIMQRDPRYRRCLLSMGWQYYAYTPAVRPASSDDDSTTPITNDNNRDDMDAIETLNQSLANQAAQETIDQSAATAQMENDMAAAATAATQ
jgi:hypothetical protein